MCEGRANSDGGDRIRCELPPTGDQEHFGAYFDKIVERSYPPPAISLQSGIGLRRASPKWGYLRVMWYEFGRLFASWLIQVDDRFTQWRSHG